MERILVMLWRAVFLPACVMLAACGHSTYYSDDFEDTDKFFGAVEDSLESVDLVSRDFALSGRFSLLSVLEPGSLEIVAVDSLLNGVDSASARLTQDRMDFSFSVPKLHYPVSLAKVKLSCTYSGILESKPMEFVGYITVPGDGSLEISLIDLLLAKRIETLVVKEGYTFGEASQRALLEATWLLEWNDDNKYGVANVDLPYNILERLAYLYGRFFLKDSSFYRTFEILSDSVGSSASWKDLLPSVKIADEIVRHYKMNLRKFNDSVLSTLKKDLDFSKDIYSNAFRVVESAYGMPKCDSAGRMAVVLEKGSEFAGENFVCDWIDSGLVWRVMNSMEGILGPCLAGGGDHVDYEGRTYVCSGQSHDWVDSYAAFWGETETDTVKTFDDIATELFGNCNVSREQKKAHEDTVFACCEKGTWIPYSHVLFYEGECTANRENLMVRIPTVEYFECRDSGWAEILAPVYYKEKCDTSGKLVVHDSSYFVCDRSWILLSEEELIPPVKNLDKCPHDRFVKKYGDQLYGCSNGFWSAVTEVDDFALPILKEGLYCDETTKGKVVDYDSVLLVCNVGWEYVRYYDADAVRMNESRQEECLTSRIGTSLQMVEKGEYLLSCSAVDNRWHNTRINYSPYSTVFVDDSLLLTGKFIDDSTYRVEQDGWTYDYTFWEFFWSDEPLYGLSRASDGSRTYAAYAWQGNLFIKNIRGAEEVSFAQLSDKSESFDSFWQGLRGEHLYSSSTGKFEYFGEDVYMDYAKAQTFCPEGFHIRDTTEWNDKGFTHYFFENAPFLANFDDKDVRIDLYWTATEKDENTQYCFEYKRYVSSGKAEQRFRECPKNLYPMVQAICVKDR